MKNFTLAIAALAAVTLVSSTTFAAEPFCGTSDYYNSRYNSRYDDRSASSYNHNYKSRYDNNRYDNNRYDKYDYLKNSYRSTLPYNTLSLTQRLNSLYSNPWSKPLFTDYTYRAKTNYNDYSSYSSRYNKNRYDRHDRFDHDRYHHNDHWRYDR